MNIDVFAELASIGIYIDRGAPTDSDEKKKEESNRIKKEEYEQRVKAIMNKNKESMESTKDALKILDDLFDDNNDDEKRAADDTDSDTDSDTYIDSSDDDESEDSDISDSSDSSDSDFSDSSDSEDDEKHSTREIPPEMTSLYKATKQDLKDVCGAQAELQQTGELLEAILKFRPDESEMSEDTKQLWNVIDQSITSTKTDITIVNNMKNGYLSSIIDISALMNECDNIENMDELDNKLNELHKNQFEYKKQLKQSTQNALNILKDVLSKFDDSNVVQNTTDEMNDSLQKFEKAQEELNVLKQDKIQKTTQMRENIDTLNVEIRVIKVKKKKKLKQQDKIKKEMSGNSASSRQSSSGGGSGGGGSSRNLDRELNILQTEYTALHTTQIKKEKELKVVETNLTQTIKEYDDKIKQKADEFNKHKAKYEESTRTLDSMIQKTGVKQQQIEQFLNLTKQIIPTMIRDEEATNRLNMGITTTCEITRRVLDRMRMIKQYKIRQYLEDSGEFIDDHDLYINILNQSGYISMRQVASTRRKYKKEIFPLFAYRTSFCNGIHGSYHYVTNIYINFQATGYISNVPRAIKKKFRDVCLDKKWKKFQKKANSLRKKQRKQTQQFYGKVADALKTINIGDKDKQNKSLMVKAFKKNTVTCVDDEENEIEIKNRNKKQRTKLKKYIKKAEKQKTSVILIVSQYKLSKYNINYKILEIRLQNEDANSKSDVKAFKLRTFLCAKITNYNDMVYCRDEEFNKIKFKFQSKDKKFKKKIKKIVQNGKKQKKDVKLSVTEIVKDGKKNKFKIVDATIA